MQAQAQGDAYGHGSESPPELADQINFIQCGRLGADDEELISTQTGRQGTELPTPPPRRGQGVGQYYRRHVLNLI